MKSAVSFCLCVLLCVGAMAQPATSGSVSAPSLTSPEPGPNHAGFLKTVQGHVQVITLARVSHVAQPGDKVMPTDRIVSGADGSVSLVLRDGMSMVVGPSSQLEVRQFSFNSTTQEGNVFVSLLRGSMRVISGMIGKAHPEAVRVDTQTATIGIRGTDFIVVADARP